MVKDWNKRGFFQRFTPSFLGGHGVMKIFFRKFLKNMPKVLLESRIWAILMIKHGNCAWLKIALKCSEMPRKSWPWVENPGEKSKPWIFGPSWAGILGLIHIRSLYVKIRKIGDINYFKVPHFASLLSDSDLKLNQNWVKTYPCECNISIVAFIIFPHPLPAVCFTLQENYAPGPLPLGVSVIDAAIALFGLAFPRVAMKHRLQMLKHFNECVKQTTKNAARQRCIQLNVFTALICGLKGKAAKCV